MSSVTEFMNCTATYYLMESFYYVSIGHVQRELARKAELIAFVVNADATLTFKQAGGPCEVGI